VILDLQRVKAERVARGITSEFMSNKLGYKSRSSYSKRENGDIPLEVNTLLEIAEILGYPFINFFTPIVPESERTQNTG